MTTKFVEISPVLPSLNIQRDISWYNKYVGFDKLHSDDMYAVLRRDNLCIHLQWHAGSKEDPLLGGSVIKIFVQNLMPIFNELIERGTIKEDRLRLHTQWNTNEIGFHDLNNNAIFFVEDI
ncbi:glyoxalase/bleomycin resistance/extradiol dioxygenase family protein [Winogradskyella sp. DF17]|uniref:Glyoxalase/bleomycin resistance/extradiol dioxygenase family protein n=1 Tax=Winogradskyella pelagia TaxID=2819984 RepID=A0ABS3T5Q5_9FLAO|nr:glyoxalase/bleomycin resistance/extradiol dioxygenase family protein [Winogradskyella sp. DF17]MBO3117769.1 glyoxalase/bleomycin resistance/extradiol dioxygenase family protein [Winogradskyella sp. DF17]